MDPFIGSGGTGFGAGGHNPGAQVPFGMMRLGPDTGQRILGAQVILPFDHYGGYSHGDNSVIAFSHTHLVGAGVGDLGNFGVMPVLLPVNATDTELESVCTKPRGHASAFKHGEGQEFACPGYYAVELPEIGVVSQVAAGGTHAGVHRHTFSKGSGRCGILIDVCHTAMGDGEKSCREAQVSVARGDNGSLNVSASMTMAGSLTGRGPGRGVRLHWQGAVRFAAADSHLNAIPAEARLWSNGAMEVRGTSSATSSSGSLGIVLSVPCSAASEVVPVVASVRAALSFVSIETAAANLDEQLPEKLGTDPMDAVRQLASQAWDVRLAVAELSVSNNDRGQALATKFFTALYHSFLAPSVFDEAGRVYPAMNSANKTRRLQRRGRRLTDMSLWDIHRTQLPWLSFVEPDVYADVLLSIQEMGEEGGGDMPRWPLANVYTGCMIGSHGMVAIAEAVAKGQAGVLNLTSVWNMMRAHAFTERPHAGMSHAENYSQLGFVPSEADQRSASLTLAYAFDDAAMATVARAAGATAAAEKLLRRSRGGYPLLWSHDRLLMCPRSAASGSLACPGDPAVPYPFEHHYTEGDALQWLWFVPHDPEGLLALFPSNASFVAKLHAFIADSRPQSKGGKWPDFLGTTLANGWYWAGNEPDLLAPWLFNFAGAQNYTAYWTRWLVDHAYTLESGGIPGNDDFGTMSAWLLWAMVGLYPLAGTDRFVVGAPSVEHVRIERAPAPLCVTAHNASAAANVYVQRAELNGVPLSEPFLTFEQLGTTAGGPGGCVSLEFWMGSAPVPWPPAPGAGSSDHAQTSSPLDP